MLRLLLLCAFVLATPAYAIQKCGSGKRITCVVDGDTFWHEGVNWEIPNRHLPLLRVRQLLSSLDLPRYGFRGCES